MAQTSESQTRRARQMRKDPTDAEKALWKLLRTLEPRFRRQHPVGDYILDFACVAAKLAVEADGGQHNDNAYDETRDTWLASQGWRVLRFWNNDILGNGEGVVQTILDALENPPPALPGEGRVGARSDSEVAGTAFRRTHHSASLRAPTPTLPRQSQGRELKALLIGIGHPYRRDDSVGIKVAEALGGITHHGEGTDLMARWQGYDNVVLVDASCSGAPAGTVTVLDASEKDLPAGLLPKGSHVFGVAEGIAMARLLGKLPRSMTVIAVEGGDFSAGEGLTPAVADALPQVLELVRKRCS